LLQLVVLAKIHPGGHGQVVLLGWSPCALMLAPWLAASMNEADADAQAW